MFKTENPPLECIETTISQEQYKVVIVKDMIDYAEIINKHNQYKTKFTREDLKKHKSEFEKILYAVAKQKPQDFKEIYNLIKQNDQEFWGVASRVLGKIHNEYAFN